MLLFRWVARKMNKNGKGPLRCNKCGRFIGKNHNCVSVDLKGERFCLECDKSLYNTGYQRWRKYCPSCEKKHWRIKERELRHQLVILFGSRCSICNYDRYEACLEFHHLYANDKKGKHFLSEIVKYPDKFQLLCNRCHRELHIENNILEGVKTVTKKIIWKGIQRPYENENLVVFSTDGKLWANLPLYLEEVNHSPTGFSWGFNGSGPSQLAYAILRTYFEISRGSSPPASKRLAQKHYQNFKNIFVSSWKGDKWEISSDDITSVFMGGERVGWL